VASGALPLRPGGGVAPCTPSRATHPAPRQRTQGLRPLVLCTLLTRFVTMRDESSGHTLHGGPVFTCVSNCARARRCTCVHAWRRLGSTRQRRVPALHMGAQRMATRTPRQRRGPRALVHRGRPRGWALVTCDVGWKQPTTPPGGAPASRALPGCGWRVVLAARRVASGNDAPERHECAAGAARALPGCGWQLVLVARVVAEGNDAAERHECAAGAARALRGCGWQLAPGAVVARGNDALERHECAAGAARALPGWGWRVVHSPSSSATVSTRHHKLRTPSPVASLDAQVREGPGAAVRSASPSCVHPCAALGPGAAACSLLPSFVHHCAATGAHAVGHAREHRAPMERVARRLVS
jgi:hypothetical protein